MSAMPPPLLSSLGIWVIWRPSLLIHVVFNQAMLRTFSDSHVSVIARMSSFWSIMMFLMSWSFLLTERTFRRAKTIFSEIFPGFRTLSGRLRFSSFCVDLDFSWESLPFSILSQVFTLNLTPPRFPHFLFLCTFSALIWLQTCGDKTVLKKFHFDWWFREWSRLLLYLRSICAPTDPCGDWSVHFDFLSLSPINSLYVQPL